MKGKVDILANFPIDTSLKKKTHSALLSMHLFALTLMSRMALLIMAGQPPHVEGCPPGHPGLVAKGCKPVMHKLLSHLCNDYLNNRILNVRAHNVTLLLR